MLKSILKTSSAVFVAASIGFASAGAAVAMDENPMVGGAPMFADKNIVENAVNSKDHTTLVAAVKAAGLVETLQSEGPFTVFAPTNAAFEALPAGTVETLLEPENKDMLTKVLTAHVVAGDVKAADLIKMIEDNGGAYNITTVSGDTITAQLDGDSVYIFDESGNAGKVTIADVNQSNGVIHVVNSVLVPK
ncbi:fasciclin domain-containing protein [Maritalea sp. S77]|uniref:fasciclin domain-containing protein n=1 Tax=Maritalea sp. S77 TaxID=3415125 RepID=UPI003C79ACCF